MRRQPPEPSEGDPQHSIEAEKATLGAMMLEREAISRARTEGLLPHHFYRDLHGSICAAIYTLHDRDKPADLVTVGELFRTEGRLEEVGGMPYLLHLQDAAPSSAAIVHYTKIVLEKYQLRRLEKLGRVASEEAGRGDTESSIVLSRLREELDRVDKPTSNIVLRPYEEILATPSQPPPWLIEPFLALGAVTMFNARQKTGKSFCALHLAQCVALGLPAFGVEDWDVQLPGNVLYWDAQNPPWLIENRVKWMHEGLELNGTRPAPGKIFLLHKRPFAVNEEQGRRQIAKLLDELNAVLWVVDVFSRSHRMANENDAAMMAEVMDHYTDLCREHGWKDTEGNRSCAILLLHHDRKGMQGMGSDLVVDSVRGSSEIPGSLDIRFALRRVQGELICYHADVRMGEALAPFTIEINGQVLKQEKVTVRYGTAATEALGTIGVVKEHILVSLQAEDEIISGRIVEAAMQRYSCSDRTVHAAMGQLCKENKIIFRKEGKAKLYRLLPRE